MSGFRVGFADMLVHTRFGPTAMTRSNYLTAAASRVDSFWVPDHLNALTPRSIMTPKHIGAAAAKLMPRPDAITEPWTMLGYLAGEEFDGKAAAWRGCDGAGHRNPAVTTQAVATLHLLTHGRAILGIGTGEREGNEPYGVALWDSNGELVSRDSPFPRCTTRCSTYRPTRGNGRRSGSQPTRRACCEPPGGTPMDGFPSSSSDRRITPRASTSCVPRPPMLAVTRCRSLRPRGFLCPLAVVMTKSTRLLSLRS
jgi:hypothetical protein